MKKIWMPLAVAITAFSFVACKKDTKEAVQEEISQETLTKIYNHGFGKNNVQKVEEGYLVEGDIILTEDYLNSAPGGNFLRIAEVEQYRTTNLVNAGGGRNISLSLSSELSSKAGYIAAVDELISRFNAENLSLTFSRVASGGNINFVHANGPYLASAGFPSGGNPYGQVKVYSRNIDASNSTTFINYLATILSHEVGHCIGFRHTDYMSRQYSCGGAPSNEGASTVGAVHIPGTPTGPDSGSWMLSCIGSGQNRPFNNNDKVALAYLY